MWGGGGGRGVRRAIITGLKGVCAVARDYSPLRDDAI